MYESETNNIEIEYFVHSLCNVFELGTRCTRTRQHNRPKIAKL